MGKSHESEKHLIKKCRELNAEIASNAVKVQTALKLSQEDQATIQSLKKEIERASKLVEQGAGMSINQENMVNNLVQTKNELLKHRDMLQGQVAQLTSQNQTLSAKVDVLTAERETEGHELH